VRLRKLISMRKALESPAYFGTLLAGDSWQAWRVLLIAIVGEALTDEERVVLKLDAEAGKPAPWPSWRLIWRPASTTGKAWLLARGA
jgi:hypothetical protein